MSFQRVDPTASSGGGSNFRKHWYFYIGSAVAVFIVYRGYESRKAAANVGTAEADASTNYSDGTATDTSNYGGYSGAAYGTTPSLYGYVDPTTGAFIGGTGGSQTVVTQPTSNAQWFQMAFAYLVQNGYDPLTVGAAFAKWEANGTLTADQYAICEAAIAFYGQPPQGMPAPHVAPPAGQTPSSVAPGWYQDQVTRNIYQVVDNKRYHYSIPAWNKVNPKPKLTPVFPTWAGYKLVYGGLINP